MTHFFWVTISPLDLKEAVYSLLMLHYFCLCITACPLLSRLVRHLKSIYLPSPYTYQISHLELLVFYCSFYLFGNPATVTAQDPIYKIFSTSIWHCPSQNHVFFYIQIVFSAFTFEQILVYFSCFFHKQTNYLSLFTAYVLHLQMNVFTCRCLWLLVKLMWTPWTVLVKHISLVPIVSNTFTFLEVIIRELTVLWYVGLCFSRSFLTKKPFIYAILWKIKCFLKSFYSLSWFNAPANICSSFCQLQLMVWLSLLWFTFYLLTSATKLILP